MKGLLLKEWYSGKRYFIILVISMMAFIMVGTISTDKLFVLFTGYIGGIIPVTCLSLDDQSKWTSYGNIFPYSRKDLVSVKYILALLMTLIVTMIVGVTTAAIPMLVGGFDKDSFYFILSAVVAVNTIVPAINLPLFFKYGSEKGRIAYYIIIFLSTSGLGIISAIISDTYIFPFNTFIFFVGMAVILVIGFIISWILSIKFYEARDL